MKSVCRIFTDRTTGCQTITSLALHATVARKAQWALAIRMVVNAPVSRAIQANVATNVLSALTVAIARNAHVTSEVQFPAENAMIVANAKILLKEEIAINASTAISA